MNKNITYVTGILILFYTVFSVGAFLFGAISYSDIPSHNICSYPPKRFEVLFPTYKLGCWLASPIDSN